MNTLNHDSDRTTVLVVDDNVMESFIVREGLQQTGFEVLEAGDGEEALSVFAEHQPQFFMLDVKMPRMDGFTVCAHIRESALVNTHPFS